MDSPILTSTCMGKTYDYPGTGDNHPLTRKWRSGFYKFPVDAPVTVTKFGLDGDKQADTKHHGGADQAILAYAGQHYPRWQQELSHPLIRPGGFAENLTINGLTEETVCIGDRCRIGEVLLEVTSARIPCWKITRRWQLSGLTERVGETGRTGWYFRVLTTGSVQAGQTVHLLDRPNPEWPVLRAYRVYMDPSASTQDKKALADCQGLSERWKSRLQG